MMTIKRLNWTGTALAAGNAITSLEGPNGFTWATESLPYTVPPGYYLGITSAQFGAKFANAPRNSMLIVDNLFCLNDVTGYCEFRTPLGVPPGITIRASVANNYLNNGVGEAQWITYNISGLLVPFTPGTDWREVFNAYL